MLLKVIKYEPIISIYMNQFKYSFVQFRIALIQKKFLHSVPLYFFPTVLWFVTLKCSIEIAPLMIIELIYISYPRLKQHVAVELIFIYIINPFYTFNHRIIFGRDICIRRYFYWYCNIVKKLTKNWLHITLITLVQMKALQYNLFIDFVALSFIVVF